MREAAGWMRPALLTVGAVTMLRAVGLWFDQTDLFVDEAQYWLWGRDLDFGYYSKPPLIAWVIRAVTALAGSDDPFWIRLPGSLCHAATALILAAAAARLWGRNAAIWVAAIYVTVPFTAVGSAMISTDTILAPFFAAALFFLVRLQQTGRLSDAVLTGAAIGVGFLAKYAAVYFLIGLAIVQIVAPAHRISARNLAALILAFGVCAAPNIAWNLTHGMSTVGHTLDNVGWVRSSAPLSSLNPSGLAEFFVSQFAVFGPILFATLLLIALRPRLTGNGWLLAFAIPPVAIVLVQALLSRAYANWAVTAYFAATLLVVPLLLSRAPRLLWATLAIHGAVAIALPLATTLAPSLTLGREKPLLARYLGRADLSRQAIGLAGFQGISTVIAADRDVLADLFYTGQDSGLTFRSILPKGKPQSYYQQTRAIRTDDPGPVLAILRKPPKCAGVLASRINEFTTKGGAYEGSGYAAYVIGADCARGL